MKQCSLNEKQYSCYLKLYWIDSLLVWPDVGVRMHGVQIRFLARVTCPDLLDR
jgi:hypothetical protein